MKKPEIPAEIPDEAINIFINPKTPKQDKDALMVLYPLLSYFNPDGDKLLPKNNKEVKKLENRIVKLVKRYAKATYGDYT